jgi:hypothetical protein
MGFADHPEGTQDPQNQEGDQQEHTDERPAERENSTPGES